VIFSRERARKKHEKDLRKSAAERVEDKLTGMAG
jgi:hypothetical protein